jgi:hypothetical protein
MRQAGTHKARRFDMASKKMTFGQAVRAKKAEAHGSRAGAPKSELTLEQSEKLAAKRSVLRTAGAPHGVVRARAGTGKTFTLIMGLAYCVLQRFIDQATPTARRLGLEFTALIRKNLGFDPVPSPQQKAVWEFIARDGTFRTVVYAAFNKAIVEEFGVKYKWLVDALRLFGIDLEFKTIHAQGLKACNRNYRLRRGWGKNGPINDYKVQDMIAEIWEVDLREVWKEKGEMVKAIEELVSLCKQTLTYSSKDQSGNGSVSPGVTLVVREEQIEELALHYDIAIPPGDLGEVQRLVQEILNRCRDKEDIERTGTITNDDMIWLPVVNKLPVWVADAGLVDEGQDLNKCQKELAKMLFRRIILVGDERQAIYGFAGADTDSIPSFIQEMSETERGVEEFRLTVTRRCGKAIVEEAQKTVPDFEAHEGNSLGRILTCGAEEAQNLMDKGDMVLCRVNAPIVGLAFAMMRANKPVNIQGRDITSGLIYFVKKSGQKEVGELENWLDRYLETEIQKLRKRRNVDEGAIVTLTDKVEVIRVFCDGAASIEDVYKRMKEFGKLCRGDKTEPNKNVTLLSSGHRAKGLEAKRVFILHPELLPHPMAKTAWAKEQEENLRYVMVTRAIDDLYFVEGK